MNNLRYARSSFIRADRYDEETPFLDASNTIEKPRYNTVVKVVSFHQYVQAAVGAVTMALIEQRASRVELRRFSDEVQALLKAGKDNDVFAFLRRTVRLEAGTSRAAGSPVAKRSRR